MTRRIAVLVVVLALTCGAAAMGGAAATLGVSSRSIDTFTAALPASTSTTSGDSAAPALVALEMFDTNANGKVDQVKATFNEALAAYTAGTTPWTLANVPSGGALSAVAVSGSIATLTIAEGGGAANTAVGTFTVALAQSTTGIRDAAGNRSSFAATAPADKANPIPVSLAVSNGGASGTPDRNDSAAITWSETLAAASICPGASGTFTLASNADLLTATLANTNPESITLSSASACSSDVRFGTLSLGAATFLSSGSATFSGSGNNATNLSWNATTNVLTLVLGSRSGSVSPSSGFTITYLSTAQMRDLANNQAVGSIVGTGGF